VVFYELPNGIVKVARPTFIDGTALPQTSGRVSEVNRRQELAKLVVGSDNFSRTAVNRVWSHFLGYGFTRGVDDLAASKPSHPEILEKLSEEFVAHGHDLKQAMRWIALSDAFNRSSKLSGEQLADMPEAGSPALFSRYYTRQLPAEEVSRSLQVAAKLRRQAGPGGSVEQARVAWLAQVRDARAGGGADQPAPAIIPSSTPLLKYATTHSLGNTLHQVTSSNMKFEQKVEHLFLAALSRQPTPQERKLAQDLAGINGQNASAALEDIWWALLNSNEFALDH
jgi:hypothetical protein